MKFLLINCNNASMIVAFAVIFITSFVASQDQGGKDSDSACVASGDGCINGMFKQSTCTCQCIPPFCPVDGNCLATDISCEDPWADCELGVNCPWWVNYLTTEECTTGRKVPDGLWDVSPSEEECCSANFPTSTRCYIELEAQPSKHPTVSLTDEDGQEIIPIQFVVIGIPDDASIGEVKAEMLSALKRILLQLSEEIEELKVTNIEEKFMRKTRNLSKQKDAKKKMIMPLRTSNHPRALEQNIEAYFDVSVVYQAEVQFGPIIIKAIRDSYDEIISQIQSSSDTMYIGGNIGINFCTIGNGGYNDCAIEKSEATLSASSPSSGGRTSMYSDDEGLAGWAIALIVILVLSIVLCGGYAVAVIFFGVANCFKFRDTDPKAKFRNNIYLDGGDGLSKHSNRDVDARSRTSGYHSRQLVLAGPQSQSVAPREDAFTINSYATSRRKVSRDPTMFIPGQEGKPDPNPNILTITYGEASTSSHRYSSSDRHSLKPKREPTMYVDGVPFAEKPKRDPTMYDDGQSNRHSMYEEEEYDDQYLSHDLNGNEDYNRSEQSITRKHSVFVDEASRQGGDRSLASKSAISKKSQNIGRESSSKKEKHMDLYDSRGYIPSYPDLNYENRSDDGMIPKSSMQNNVAASLFDWNASTPNLNDNSLVGKNGHKRQTKSFYK